MKSKTALPFKSWDEKGYRSRSNIKSGIPAYEGVKVDYKRNGQSILNVRLSKPIIVSVANKQQKWGFFQFPSIYLSQDSALVASWNMAEDHPESYGKGRAFAVSYNRGKSWSSPKEDPPVGGGVLLPNGDRIKTYTPKAVKSDNLTLPDPIETKEDSYGTKFTFFKLSQLPKVVQGVYLKRLKKENTNWKIEQAALNDPHALRYEEFGLFPVVWWGDMHIVPDGSIIAGKYPGIYLSDSGKVGPGGISFYRSIDEGHTWTIQGKISYNPDPKIVPDEGNKTVLGFTEPGFEILSDGTLLCVMRSSEDLAIAPMYMSRSTNLGKTWTKPKRITNAGVKPQLLQLENGVIVLASGRPGVQLRFSIDGKGEKWTDPFEMIPFKNVSKYDKDPVSCGYTDLLPIGPDSFLLIYSDFNHKDMNDKNRKAIKIKKVKVTPHNKIHK